jgi:hypothetical protein
LLNKILHRFPNTVTATCDAALGKKGVLKESSVKNVKGKAELDYTKVKTWAEFLSQFGLATRGLIYGVISFLAALAAIGAGGKTTDPSGALEEVAIQPLGKPLLIVIAVGLVGYALWRFVQAIADPKTRVEHLKGLSYVLAILYVV